MAILISPAAPVSKDVRKRQPNGKTRVKTALFQELLSGCIEREAATEKAAQFAAPKATPGPLVYPLVYPRTAMANIVDRGDLTNVPSRLFWPA